MTASISKLLHSWLFIDLSEHHYTALTSKFNNFLNRSSTMLNNVFKRWRERVTQRSENESFKKLNVESLDYSSYTSGRKTPYIHIICSPILYYCFGINRHTLGKYHTNIRTFLFYTNLHKSYTGTRIIQSAYQIHQNFFVWQLNHTKFV